MITTGLQLCFPRTVCFRRIINHRRSSQLVHLDAGQRQSMAVSIGYHQTFELRIYRNKIICSVVTQRDGQSYSKINFMKWFQLGRWYQWRREGVIRGTIAPGRQREGAPKEGGNNQRGDKGVACRGCSVFLLMD
jgi:hypothetical protein